jgi:hypothetical protein
MAHTANNMMPRKRMMPKENNTMPTDLLKTVCSASLAPARVAELTREIHDGLLRDSAHIEGANFTRIHPQDLRSLFSRYDACFFAGLIKETLDEQPISFRFSKRMTSSGGATKQTRSRMDANRKYEIALSSTLLFGCFAGDDHRPITVCGITCKDRLESLQRVMEHEITHLLEFMLWDKSSCSDNRFHGISRRFFGHTDFTHQLITPREKLVAKYGIYPGMTVRFRFDGDTHVGLINRLNKRATVLVADPDGEKYSDGNRYAKYYIPARDLEIIEE